MLEKLDNFGENATHLTENTKFWTQFFSLFVKKTKIF